METKFRTLKANEIECRIGTISAKGCSLLLYKDARCDMNVLDETVGAMNWKRSHTRDNANCIVSIYDEEKKEWVSKEDTGKESVGEAEKGLASDSFKRACVNWGIGRELYTSPFIWVMPKNKEMGIKIKTTDEKTGEVKEELKEFYINAKGKWETKTRFTVTDINYDENREINLLVIKDNKGHTRFELMPTEEQKERLLKAPVNMATIQQILNLVEVKNADIKNIHKKYGVSEIKDLTMEQGLEAVKILENQDKRGE